MLRAVQMSTAGVVQPSKQLRPPDEHPPAAKWLSAVGFVLSGVTGWLGAELMERHGIGMYDAAARGQEHPSMLAPTASFSTQRR